MNPLYEWLYDYYVEPGMDETLLGPAHQALKEAWLAVEKKLSADDNLTAEDYIGSLKANWGALAFDRGIKVGFLLSAGLVEGPAEQVISPPRAI